LAVAADPRKSDRAIAEQIGVSHPTVAKARKKATTGKDFPVDKRTGRDGKARKMPSKPAIVEIGDMIVTPTRAKQIARQNAKLAALSVRDQVNAFIDELTKFEEDFGERLLAWHEGGPVLSHEAQHALVLFLSNFSMRMQKLAQQIDGR
jgi:hypothetical protein